MLRGLAPAGSRTRPSAPQAAISCCRTDLCPAHAPQFKPLKQQKAIQTGDKVAIAVSGGALDCVPAVASALPHTRAPDQRSPPLAPRTQVAAPSRCCTTCFSSRTPRPSERSAARRVPRAQPLARTRTRCCPTRTPLRGGSASTPLCVRPICMQRRRARPASRWRLTRWCCTWTSPPRTTTSAPRSRRRTARRCGRPCARAGSAGAARCWGWRMRWTSEIGATRGQTAATAAAVTRHHVAALHPGSCHHRSRPCSSRSHGTSRSCGRCGACRRARAGAVEAQRTAWGRRRPRGRQGSAPQTTAQPVAPGAFGRCCRYDAQREAEGGARERGREGGPPRRRRCDASSACARCWGAGARPPPHPLLPCGSTHPRLPPLRNPVCAPCTCVRARARVRGGRRCRT